jgi:hypothetical protein
MAGLTVRSHKTSYYLIEVVSMAGLTVRSYKTSYYLIEVVSMAGLTVSYVILQSNLP